MDELTTVLVCRENFDQMMTAVYDGWVRMREGQQVEIVVGEESERNFFSRYIEAELDMEKSEKVIRTIKKKISEEVFWKVFYVSCHYSEKRADVIFRFLQKGFRYGRNVLGHLADPDVMAFMELERKARNEAHLFIEFVRFTEVKREGQSLLFSRIHPKCNVVYLIGEHFADRFPMENWMIYDERRNISAVHRAGEEWYVQENVALDDGMLCNIEQEGEYEKLWKTFFQAIAIESRYNPKCQNTHLPKWYRKNMTEWK